MNADRLLAYYERIADAPDAVQRLRRFILDLAVRGKLVPQDPNDDPAAELLERIGAEKARRVKVGKLRMRKPAVSIVDQPFDLPSGWSLTRLAIVAECLDYMRKPINGTERKQRIAGKPQSELFPYFGATRQQGWIDDYIFDEELILLGEDGVPFFEPLRAKAYLIAGKSWVNNHAHVFRGILISPPYVVHYLNVFDYSGRVVGATRSKLNQSRALDIPIPLPPLAEQHRIVAKVDELMALCDRLEAARTEREVTRDMLAAASLVRLNDPDPDPVVFRNHAAFALENLTPLTTRRDQIKALRQTILNLAVRGKLVEQDPNDEPASEFLKRIAVEKARRAKTGEVREKAPILSVRPFESDSPIPAAWASVKLVELSNIVMGQSPSGETYNTDGEGVPLINGPVEFSDGPFGLTVANQYTTAPTKVCDKGDFLMCVRGSTTGRSNIAAFDACIGRGVAAIQPLFGDGFVRLFLWSMRKRIINMGRGVAFPSITRKQLENLLVPLPPLAEQHRIVAKVDELMALCDRLEKKLAGGDDTRRRLLDVLLHEVLVMGSDRKSVA